MADSVEQKIVTRALELLADIDGTGDYQTALGTTIVNGSDVPSVADSRPNWDQDELPAITTFQGPVDPTDRDDEAQKVLRKMNLVFRGFLRAGTDASNARKLGSDIMRAIRTAGDKWTVGGVNLAQYTEEGRHEIIYEEGSFEIAGVQQEINIFYVASHLDMEA